MSRNTKPGIVFAHGIWADGSSFSKVIPALQAEGYEVMSTQKLSLIHICSCRRYAVCRSLWSPYH